MATEGKSLVKRWRKSAGLKIGAAVFTPIALGAGYLELIAPKLAHIEFRNKAVADSNCPADEVDEYLRRGVDWDFIKHLVVRDVNIPRLDILLSDSEIQDRAYGIREDVIGIIMGITKENPDGDIAFNWNDYNLWRTKGGGALGLQIAKSSEWNLENILRLPKIPSVGALNAFQQRQISDQYFVPLLFNDVAIVYICDMHKAGVATEYSLPFIKNGRGIYDIICLWKDDIPREYALPLKDLSPREIADLYSKQMLGIPDKERQEYRNISCGYMNDDRINLWRERGMTLAHLREIAAEGLSYVRQANELVKKGELSPTILDSWTPEISISDTFFSIVNGYTLQEALDITHKAHLSVREFHEKMQQYGFMRDMFEKKREQLRLKAGVAR